MARFPARGNILFIDVGTTEQLYQCSGKEVLAHFCHHLRTYGCFACMINCLFRKEIADKAREKAGRIFLGGVPETSLSFIVLGMARPDGYAFFDGFGAIAGRSRNSSFASILSRGKASRRTHEYVEEFRGADLLPLHEPKFLAVSNALAGTISQVRTLLPDHFGQYDFDRVTLARKTIDDLYVDRTVPWVDDPAFLAQVDEFISSLPAPAAAEIFAYRDECRARSLDADKTAASQPNNAGNSVSLLESLRKADRKFAWRLFRDTGRNPLGRYWISGGTTCIDMSLYGCRDIADTARNFPRVLAHFDRYNEGFANYYRQQLGMLGESLVAEPQGGRRVEMAGAR